MSPISKSTPYALFVETWNDTADTRSNHFNMKHVRDLESGELERIQEACKFASDAVAGFIVFVRQSLWDLNRSIQEVQADAEKGMNAESGYRADEELRYRVLNVCTAVRMFEEHVNADINRKFGKESEQGIRAGKLFNSIYDASFAYRLLYRLRNAIVHGSRGLMAMHIELYLDESVTPPLPRGELRIDLDREAFNRLKIQAALRSEVMSSHAAPNLLRLCNEVLPTMEDLAMRLTEVLQPGLPKMLFMLADLMNQAADAGGVPLLASINHAPVDTVMRNGGEMSDPGSFTMDMSTFTIPHHVAELVVSVCDSEYRPCNSGGGRDSGSADLMV